jgi:hypothetical protein
MDTVPLHSPARKGSISSASAGRLSILQGLVPVAIYLVSSQLEIFSERLAEALFRLSDQALRPDEVTNSFNAFQLLKRNNTNFCRLVSEQINAELTKEVNLLHAKKKIIKVEKHDFSLVTFGEMESKVLIRNLSQALEVNNSESLLALNIRVGNLLKRTPIDVSQNPFRPEVFVRAVFQAWVEFDTTSESKQIVLRLLQPNLFLELQPILNGINVSLIERGIVVDLNDAFRTTPKLKQQKREASRSERVSDLDPYLHDKLRSIFSGAPVAMSQQKTGSNLQWSGKGYSGEEHYDDRFSGSAAANVVDREFFDYLSGVQRLVQTNDVTQALQLSALRQLMQQTVSESLTQVDQSTIELLARVFDFVFNDASIPGEIKTLIAQLQIPTLKVALLDKDFFFKESHPARVLIDALAKSSVVFNTGSHSEDPLYHMIEGIVDRVQQEFDEQIDLFSDVVADLEAFLKEEEERTQEAISRPVADALKQEKMRVAKDFAEHDVSIRVDTGEVAGFLEAFLLEHWVRILTIAHSVKEKKPHALENALKTMDDLVWSLKPKNSAEERKLLITKLPSMLSLLNAWLNAIKWDEPERVVFFSKLAERHAAIARAPLEFSPRRQLEIAVNIAQRASERRLDRHAQDHIVETADEWTAQVEILERGTWLDFAAGNDPVGRYKLAWVSPKRTRYIFTNRQGQDAFSLSGDELTAKLREGIAAQIIADSVVDRALVEALRDPPN